MQTDRSYATWVLPTFSSEPEYNADMDYAVVRLTQNEIGGLLVYLSKFYNLKETDRSLACMQYYDGTPEYIAWGEWVCNFDWWDSLAERNYRLTDEEVRAFWEVDFAVEGLTEEVTYLRTDNDKLIVTADAIYWSANPRHSYITVTTKVLSGVELRQAWNELEVARARASQMSPTIIFSPR